MSPEADGSASAKGLSAWDPEVRSRLERIRDRSPHDFVPGVPVARDWEHWLDGQFGVRDSRRDLRSIWRGAEGAFAVLASWLQWDSSFFGVETARIDAVLPLDGAGYPAAGDLGPVVRDFLSHARGRGVRYLFGAVDQRDAALCRALSESGFEIIETRVTFHRALADFEPKETHPVREATQADIPALQRVAVQMVNPLDRFHADPSIGPGLADRLMAQWVEASISEGFADFVLVPDEPEPGAFVTVRTHESAWAAQGIALAQPVVLGAVLPRLKGWYLKLLTESCRRLRQRGATHAFVVTQSGNAAAKRTFEKAGFVSGRTELVFRWTENPRR